MEKLLNTEQTFDALATMPQQAKQAVILSSVASDWNHGETPKAIEKALETARDNGAEVSILTSYYEPNKNQTDPSIYVSDGISRETTWTGRRTKTIFERIQAFFGPQFKARFLIADDYAMITSSDPTEWCQGNIETSVASTSPELSTILHRLAFNLTQTGQAPQTPILNLLEDGSYVIYDGGRRHNNHIREYDDIDFAMAGGTHNEIVVGTELFPGLYSPELIKAAKRGVEVTIITNQKIGLLGAITALTLYINKAIGGKHLHFIEIPASPGIRMRGKWYVIRKDATPVAARVGSASVGGIDHLLQRQNIAYYSSNPEFLSQMDDYAEGVKQAVLQLRESPQSSAINAYVGKRPHTRRTPLRIKDL